jgi:ABC-type proline/glycine betaine transport system permease subunit
MDGIVATVVLGLSAVVLEAFALYRGIDGAAYGALMVFLGVCIDRIYKAHQERTQARKDGHKPNRSNSGVRD